MENYKHVVIIGVDGAGIFFRQANTPRMDEIFKKGSCSYEVKTSYPTISGQCWGSMLHGVLPEFHRLTNEIVSSRRYDPQSPYPSLFRVIRENDSNAVLASFCNWDPINYGIIEEELGVTEGTGSDPEVCDKICDWLSDHIPTVLFVQFDSVDGAGHWFGYGAQGHLDAISAVDELIGRIYDKLGEIGILDDTLFLVTADHGGTPGGSHGGNTDAERIVYMGISGRSVVNRTIPDAEVRDIPAIALYALGIPCPDSWTGRLPEGIFNGVGGGDHIEAEVVVSAARRHKMKETPDLSEMKDLLKNHPVKAYLPFDGSVETAIGDTETEPHGKLYFSDAYFGSGISLDDGYITLKDVTVGKSSFTVAFWLKTNGTGDGDPAILSNKDWNNGGNDGFVLSLRSSDLKFNFGDSQLNKRWDVSASLPPDVTEGWLHVLVTVDREQNRVTFYLDFKEEGSYEICEELRNSSMDSLVLNIGQDGSGQYKCHLPAQLDDFILTGDVFTSADVKSLKKYYAR